MLISRTQSRLDEVANEIEAKCKVKTKTLAVDFGKADAGTWSILKAEVRSATTGLEGDQPLFGCIHILECLQARCSATSFSRCSADETQGDRLSLHHQPDPHMAYADAVGASTNRYIGKQCGRVIPACRVL